MTIRVDVITLSVRAKTTWASPAYLSYLQAFGVKYVMNALCSSSVSAARSAIEAYNLPADTKTNGNPQDLAEDPEALGMVDGQEG